MAYVVATRPGRFEVRESRSTPAGPRCRTLASFREFGPDVLATVRERAAGTVDPRQLQAAAVRAGAPLAAAPVDRAGRRTLRLLARGERLDPELRHLLLDALRAPNGNGDAGDAHPVSDTARAAAQWIDSSAEERGEALRDLLELADALPAPARSRKPGFPALRSA